MGCSPRSGAVWGEGWAAPSASVSSVSPPPVSVPAAPTRLAPESPDGPGTALPDSSGTSPSRVSLAPVEDGDPDRFVAAVRAQLPELAMDRRDEEIEDLGAEACASSEMDLSGYGVSAAQARQLRRVAQADLCP
ncbi:hypothetical protein [Actinoplanes siamensis]|nr:hypothetical protein [Actinoplanes siamensis]